MTTEHNIDEMVLAEIFGGKTPRPTDTILSFSTNLVCSYLIIDHYKHSGWNFGVKAMHYPSGDLQYRVHFAKDKQIVRNTHDTMELAICNAGLMVARQSWVEHENTDEDDDGVFTTSSAKVGSKLSIEEYDDVYSLFLEALMSGLLPVNGTEETTLLSLLDYARKANAISLGDVGSLLDKVVQLFSDTVKSNGMEIVRRDSDGKDK